MKENDHRQKTHKELPKDGAIIITYMKKINLNGSVTKLKNI